MHRRHQLDATAAAPHPRAGRPRGLDWLGWGQLQGRGSAPSLCRDLGAHCRAGVGAGTLLLCASPASSHQAASAQLARGTVVTDIPWTQHLSKTAVSCWLMTALHPTVQQPDCHQTRCSCKQQLSGCSCPRTRPCCLVCCSTVRQSLRALLFSQSPADLQWQCRVPAASSTPGGRSLTRGQLGQLGYQLLCPIVSFTGSATVCVLPCCHGA